jgi:hypothetical protein
VTAFKKTRQLTPAGFLLNLLDASWQTLSRCPLLFFEAPALFEDATFECLGVSIRDFRRFFVLRVSSTRTRTRTRRNRIEYEYEYHFIEYEYEGCQNSATSKLAPQAQGNKHRLAPQAQGNKHRLAPQAHGNNDRLSSAVSYKSLTSHPDRRIKKSQRESVVT